MARRPAYNTKAEISRRAAERAALLAEFSDAGDEAEALVPLISAWTQSRRRRREYQSLFGKPYTPFPSELPADQRLAEARMQIEMAFSFSYVAQRALEAALQHQGRAHSAGASALSLLHSLAPYSDEQLSLINALHAPDT